MCKDIQFKIHALFVSGVIRGYHDEKQAADDCIRMLEDKKEVLATELEKTRLRMQSLEECHSELVQREQDLEKQRQTLESSVGDSEQGACLHYFVNFLGSFIYIPDSTSAVRQYFLNIFPLIEHNFKWMRLEFEILLSEVSIEGPSSSVTFS